MRTARFAAPSLALLVALPLLALGCAEGGDDGDDADSSESDVKKKVKPKGGNGAFDLLKPAWSTDGFGGQHQFGGSNVALGGRVERVPGAYALTLGGQDLAAGDGRALAQAKGGYAIAAGTVVQQKAAGLRVRFAEPVTLGRAFISVGDAAAPLGATEGYLSQDGPWRRRPNGASWFVLPATFRVRSSAEGGAGVMIAVAEGELGEVVLPIARVNVVGDDYDPAYPTFSGCTEPRVLVGAEAHRESFPVRHPDGTVDPTTYVVPQGAGASAVLDTYGVATKIPTVAGATHTFTLNRLEVDDVEVNSAAGGTVIVKGKFTVQRKVGAELTPLSCAFPTHTGVDLPDGTYVVTTTAAGASGPVTHVEEVSFP